MSKIQLMLEDCCFFSVSAVRVFVRCSSCTRLWVWVETKICSSVAFCCVCLYLSAKMMVIYGREAVKMTVIWLTVKQKMGLTMPHTSTHSHSQPPMHTHPGIQLYFLTITLCVVPWLLCEFWIRPHLISRTHLIMRNFHIRYLSWGNVSPDELLVSFQLHQLHNLPSWLATNTGCSNNPGDQPGYICWADAMRHG